MLNGTPVELTDMLDCRERRANLQRELLARCHAPLVSFTLNVPGPVKTTPALRKLFDGGLAQIRRRLIALNAGVLDANETHAATGDEAVLVVAGDAAAIKVAMTAIEDAAPINRLFDIDVIDADGRKLSRPVPRLCLLCGNVAAECARSRRHSAAELTAEIERLLAAEYGPC